MVVCHCLAVTDRAISAAIMAGAGDVGALADWCGAGAGCRGCWPALERILAQTKPSVSMRGGT